MTAVIGILNKEGVAIAADSAVTRTRSRDWEKVTKNGNKMIRLSEAQPVSVMLTGNAYFLGNPWDVIARRYRQKRGSVIHKTVEDVVIDFFRFLSETTMIWDDSYQDVMIDNEFRAMIEDVLEGCEDENERTDDGSMKRPRSFIKAMRKNLAQNVRASMKGGRCPQFADYPVEEFRAAVKGLMDEFLDEMSWENDSLDRAKGFPVEVLAELRDSIEEALYARIATRHAYGDYAQLVFTGFGSEQTYPSLISAIVCDGFNRHVNYFIEDRICISDETPVAICPFAQKDVVMALLRGLHPNWSSQACNGLRGKIMPRLMRPEGNFDPGLYRDIQSIRTDDLKDRFIKDLSRAADRNLKSWEKALEKYDLRSMAELADSLIDLTGFHKILTFQQEGVGGTVDLAVISKNEGFTWLRRKSWYQHKDIGGRYGSMGV